MARNSDDQIFIFFGHLAFTIQELGPAADMSPPKAFQYMIDQGMLGEEYVGMAWHDVIRSSDLKLEGAPSEDEELLFSLYSDYNVALQHCKELGRQGLLTKEAKEHMMSLRLKWLAAKKLSTP